MIPCPSCGFIVFPGPAGSFDFCPICQWEDDESMLGNPCVKPTAESYSLAEWQKLSLEKFPLSIKTLRGYVRDPAWRPLTDEEITKYQKHADAIEAGAELDESVFRMRDAYWNKPIK